jgi:hypothetical protein
VSKENPGKKIKRRIKKRKTLTKSIERNIEQRQKLTQDIEKCFK